MVPGRIGSVGIVLRERVEMGELASLTGILEFAVAREIESYQIYMELAKMVHSPDTRMLLEGLAQEELDHKAQLELEVTKQGLTMLPVEVSDYVIQGKVEADMGIKDTLLLAMEKEKSSFRLYIHLRDMVDDAELRKILLELAEQEARHKLLIEINYDKLTDG